MLTVSGFDTLQSRSCNSWKNCLITPDFSLFVAFPLPDHQANFCTIPRICFALFPACGHCAFFQCIVPREVHFCQFLLENTHDSHSFGQFAQSCLFGNSELLPQCATACQTDTVEACLLQ